VSAPSLVTHVGFSDESHYNTGRFRSLGLVTLPVTSLPGLTQKMQALLLESDVRESKWKKLVGAKERFAAKEVCRLAVEEACAGRLRVDVLVWDTHDSRHNQRRRDDIANLERMYYHLFRNVMRSRWSVDSVWRFCPDEQTAINWNAIAGSLASASVRLVDEQPWFGQNVGRLRLVREFGIQEIEPARSDEEVGVQLADLFAGLAVFSRATYAKFETWRAARDPQMGFGREGNSSPVKVTRAEEERFCVVQELDRLCKLRRLGVSLTIMKGLYTPQPSNPINFWPYVPQSDLDKAPTK